MRFFLISLFLAPAFAMAQTAIGTFKDWQAFHTVQNGQKICYMASFPTKSGGNFKSRGKPYMLVTTHKGSAPEVSVSSGYPYKDASTVQATANSGQKFTFFTTQDTPKIAWLKDSAADKAAIAAMKKGASFSAKGFSKIGSHSVDTFSLMGFTSAYNAISNACR